MEGEMIIFDPEHNVWNRHTFDM